MCPVLLPQVFERFTDLLTRELALALPPATNGSGDLVDVAGALTRCYPMHCRKEFETERGFVTVDKSRYAIEPRLCRFATGWLVSLLAWLLVLLVMLVLGIILLP